MILVVGGIKGGSGKTTIATNLAQIRASEGKKVLLVDADEQKSAWEWSQHRDQQGLPLDKFKSHKDFVTVCMTGKAVYSNLWKIQEDYDSIIVDTGGRDTTSQRAAMCCADILLLPFKPSSIDIWTVGSIRNMINECSSPNQKLKAYAVISQADSTGKDNDDAIKIIQEYEDIRCLDCYIGNRKAFRNAAAEGLGVCELTPKDEKACREIIDLYHRIYE